MITAAMIEAEIPHLRRYARALMRGHRDSADDLVQATLERAWRKRELWRASGRLRSWLFRVLYRLYLDGRRAGGASAFVSLEAWQGEVAVLEPRSQDTLHCRDVFAAIDTLADKYRNVLLVMALEQPSYREGARMLGLKVGTFRSRLSRARDQLNAQFDQPAHTTAQESSHVQKSRD